MEGAPSLDGFACPPSRSDRRETEVPSGSRLVWRRSFDSNPLGGATRGDEQLAAKTQGGDVRSRRVEERAADILALWETRKDIFLRMMEGLATPQAAERKTVMIDATYLKAHRTASSLRVKKGVRAA